MEIRGGGNAKPNILVKWLKTFLAIQTACVMFRDFKKTVNSRVSAW